MGMKVEQWKKGSWKSARAARSIFMWPRSTRGCTGSKNGAGSQGGGVEKPNQRRRRHYWLTAEGQRVPALEREKWQEFAGAVGRIAGVEHA